MKTICKECIFAQWTEDVQTGCEFNRLDKFKKQNKLELLSEDKIYYQINRFCNTCTNGELGEYSLGNAKEIVRKRIIPTVDYIILCDNCLQNDIDNSLEHIINSTIKPKHVYFMFTENISLSIFYQDVIDILNDHNIKGTIIVVYNNLPINEAISKCKSQFYSIFYGHWYIPPDFIEKKIDKPLNEDLKQFLCAHTESYHEHWSTFMRNTNSLFKYETPIKERIKFFEKENKELVLIWK